MEEQLSATIEIKKAKRIWEIDALRGFAFLMMAWDHFTYDMGFIFGELYTNEKLKAFCDWCYRYKSNVNSNAQVYINFFLCWGLFMFLSGISATLSRNNLKRGIKVGIVALLFTFGTWCASLLGFGNFTVHFGILHVLAVCMLLTPLLNKLKNYQLLIVALLGLIPIFFIKDPAMPYFVTDNKFLSLLLPFNFLPKNYATIDYQPLFPRFSIYVLGIIVGRLLYKEKQSIIPWNIPRGVVCFFGKNTLWLYFAHQVLLFGLLAIGILFK